MPLSTDPYEASNAPDRGTAIPDAAEGETNETNREEGNDLMTTIDSSTDAHDFVQYMHEFNPNIKPGTPLWDLYVKEREDESTTGFPFKDMIENLYPDVEAPGWANPDETQAHRVPSCSRWSSIPARINLRRHYGFYNPDTRTYATPHLNLSIAQQVTAEEATVRVARLGTYETSERLEQLDAFTLTLDEATELAHTLLLLLDVVNETAGA